MNEWLKLYPQIPSNGQVVFIYVDGEGYKAIYVAQCTYVGKNELGTDEISFYAYRVNIYITDEQVKYWMPVILPTVPNNVA